MSVSKANGVKKRRAPLPPEEIYRSPLRPEETSNLVDESLCDTGATSTERMPRTLPLGEPVRTL